MLRSFPLPFCTFPPYFVLLQYIIIKCGSAYHRFTLLHDHLVSHELSSTRRVIRTRNICDSTRVPCSAPATPQSISSLNFIRQQLVFIYYAAEIFCFRLTNDYVGIPRRREEVFPQLAGDYRLLTCLMSIF